MERTPITLTARVSLSPTTDPGTDDATDTEQGGPRPDPHDPEDTYADPHVIYGPLGTTEHANIWATPAYDAPPPNDDRQQPTPPDHNLPRDRHQHDHDEEHHGQTPNDHDPNTLPDPPTAHPHPPTDHDEVARADSGSGSHYPYPKEHTRPPRSHNRIINLPTTPSTHDIGPPHSTTPTHHPTTYQEIPPTDRGWWDDLSRLTSSVLRHKSHDLGLYVKEDGSVPLNDLLKLHRFKNHGTSYNDFFTLTTISPKARFHMHQDTDNTWFIRATAGHSIDTDPNAHSTPLTPTECCQIHTVIHATMRQHVPSIIRVGIIPGGHVGSARRADIMTTPAKPNGQPTIQGRPHTDTYVYINLHETLDHNQWHQSDYGYVTTRQPILPTHIHCIRDAHSGTVLWPPEKSPTGTHPNPNPRQPHSHQYACKDLTPQPHPPQGRDHCRQTCSQHPPRLRRPHHWQIQAPTNAQQQP
jgi:hypothetical protein